MSKHKKFFLFFFLIIILLMSVGYSSFATDININGTAKIIGSWDIEITDIKKLDICENCDAGALILDDTTSTFNTTLVKPGDKIICEIIITNKGTIPAKLQEVKNNFDPEPSSLVITTTDPKDTLEPGESTSYKITISYDKAISTNQSNLSKNFTSTIEYVQA